MTSTSGRMGFRIPKVTQADLEAFQRSHFVYEISTAAVQSLHYGSSTEAWPLLDHDEEQDSLGYYPDGVKRSLTDEQISMFRHSEIYSLLRKRQLQKENQEADGNASTASQAATLTLDTSDHPTEQEASENPMGSCESVKQDEATSNMVKRQKRHEDGEQGGEVEASSSRRQIRELDGMSTGIDYLDYGEEPSVNQHPQTFATPTWSLTVGSDPADEAVQHPAQQSGSAQSAKQGKLIWWPTIG
ncbi:MAG: hypothetical protein Q9184_007291 [Pyrenodesmia sp. 2 TL-2023]